MDKAVAKFKKRRQMRLDSRFGRERDSVAEYRKRREMRMDAGVGWVFGILKKNGVDTEGMSVPDAFKALEELHGGKFISKNKNVHGKKRGKIGPNLNLAIGKKEASGRGYKGKPGEVKTGKGGKLAPKSESAKRIDVSDAQEETRLFKESGGKKGLEKNSLTDYIDENGNLKPERQKVHDEIIQKFFADKIPAGGKATLVMSGGGPASGKSFIEKSARSEFGDDTTVTIDPDAFKAMLPGYEAMAKKDENTAGFYHEESSALAKRAYQYAVDNGINVVYDGTGDGSVKSVMKKLKTAQDAGYAVKGSYVTVDTDEALRRNQARYENMLKKYESGESDIPPRLPKDETVRKIHAAVTDISLQVASLFDNWELTDNNGAKGEKKPVIARCKKGGEIEVVPGMEERMQRYIDKGNSGAKVVNGKIVFPKK